MSNPALMFRIIQIWVPISFLNIVKKFSKQYDLRQLKGDPSTTDAHHDYIIVGKHRVCGDWYLKITLRWMDQFNLYELKFHVIQKVGHKAVLCSPMCNCNASNGITKIEYAWSI